MGKTDASVIKLPEGYSLKKIDERTYELVKIDDFKKGDFLFAKSRTGDLIDYVFINTGGLKANFLYKDKNVLICNLEFNFSNNYDISKATLEQIAAMRRLFPRIILLLLMVKLFPLQILLSALLLLMM